MDTKIKRIATKVLNMINQPIFFFLLNTSDMDEDFVASVKLLVPYVLSRDKMVPKRINGRDVTGKDMLKYVKVSTFYRCTLHSAFNTGVTVILKKTSFYPVL